MHAGSSLSSYEKRQFVEFISAVALDKSWVLKELHAVLIT